MRQDGDMTGVGIRSVTVADAESSVPGTQAVRMLSKEAGYDVRDGSGTGVWRE